MENKPKVTLVGAGPGDPDFITLKGIKALQAADVVLYDALAHPDHLDCAPANAIKIFVGKKKGVCQFKQEDINDLIVQYARSHGHVVRLKGGDPYVFGRGHEEEEHAGKFGIEVEVVPGISSSYAIPEINQIPLTRRGVNESFWVVTGTTKGHELSNDIRMAANSTATVVILMGMHKLPEIVRVFQESGKGNEPVAIIQNGSLPEQKIAVSNIDGILDEREKTGISSPAVIVIGGVVRCSERMRAMLEKTANG